MRQALVLKNPKWEPFTTASDAFKAVKDGENAVLVVRRHCKEKTQHKTMKTFAKSSATAAKKAALLLALCVFGLTARAQQDITTTLAATTIPGASTNTSAGATAFGWNIDQTTVFSVSVVGTNGSPTNPVVVRFDTSVNGTDWSDNAYSWVLTPNGTTATTAITRITNTVGGVWMRVGDLQNTNLTAITYSRMIVLPKENK